MTEASPVKENVAFFPWLRITEPIVVDRVRLVPYKRGLAPQASTTVQKRLDSVLASHFDHPNSPITHATVVEYEGGNPFRSLNDEEVQYLFELREFLTISALSGRGYFEQAGLSYCNSHLFQLVVQTIQGSGTAVAIQSRRRDGTTNVVWSEGLHKVRRPDHVHPPLRTPMDGPLLQGLVRAERRTGFDRVYDAIISFNLANTDSDETVERFESVLMCGAFERLLDCGHGAEKFARAFTGCVVPQTPLDVRAVAKAVHAMGRDNSRSMREIWARDLYVARNAYAHGHKASSHRAIWSLREHLLLGAYVFPLALKSILAQANHYELTDDDLLLIDAFEHLAAADLFTPTGDPWAPSSWPWNTVMEHFRDKMVERTLKMLWKERGDP